MKIIHGSNLLPENLETGEYKIEANAEINGLNPLAIIVYSRDPYVDGYAPSQMTYKGCYVNGIPSRLILLCVFFITNITTNYNDE